MNGGKWKCQAHFDVMSVVDEKKIVVTAIEKQFKTHDSHYYQMTIVREKTIMAIAAKKDTNGSAKHTFKIMSVVEEKTIAATVNKWQFPAHHRHYIDTVSTVREKTIIATAASKKQKEVLKTLIYICWNIVL